MSFSVLKRIFLYLLFPLLLIGCGHDHEQSEENGHEHSEEEKGHDEHGGANEVHLNGPQLRNAGIETGRPKRMDLARSIQATGKLELPPGNKAGVSPMVGGNVKEIRVIQGTHVEKGEVLATLEHPDIIQLQQDFVEDREELSYRKQEFERVQKLYGDSVGSARELQKTRSAYEGMKGRVEGQVEKLRSIGIDTADLGNGKGLQRRVPLKAPIGGVVSEVNVKRGSHAGQNEELFEILDIHHMHIDLLVYEKDLHEVAIGQNVLFDLIGREMPRPMRAEVFGIGNSFDEKEKAARVHAEIKDTLGPLFPGIYVEALIDVDSAHSSLVLPEKAVLRFEGSHYAFLDRGENENGERVFERVELRKGIEEAGYVEVEGLGVELSRESDVVFKGAPYLLRHMRKGTGGHNH